MAGGVIAANYAQSMEHGETRQAMLKGDRTANQNLDLILDNRNIKALLEKEKDSI